MSEPRRVDLYDGLRGVAIVLVVLSHGWQLWPVDWIDSHAWVRPFFRNGNSGVTIFLVAAGFLMYRALTTRRDLEQMRPDTTLLRRIVRVGPTLWVFLLVAVVVSVLDGSADAWNADTTASVWHVVTYTWNWYVQGNLVTSRPDFGHLWYLSVDMQAFVIMAGFLYMLRRRPVGLLWALTGFYLVLLWWRFHVSQTEFIFQVLVRTTVRMDPFVVGVLVAAALPQLRRLEIPQRTWAWAAGGSLVALVPLLFWCDHDSAYLRWGGTVLEWDVALFFVAVALGGSSAFLTFAVGNEPLVRLGRASLTLYIWHYPVFMFVQRHATGWSWQAVTVVALLATVAVSYVSERLVDRRVIAFLRRPGWRELDDGVPAWVGMRARPAVSQLRSRSHDDVGAR
ncbi:MAG TPA: acyltransferase [Nocardioides sp.]|nr:acyltransferase [Nocardioides sp.]